MRATLEIADDVLQAAKDHARRENRTAGEVISELARSALTGRPQAPGVREPPSRCGFRPFPKRGGVVTNERIDALREDDAYRCGRSSTSTC